MVSPRKMAQLSAFVFCSLLLFSTLSAAQGLMGGPPLAGIFHPKVGQGGVYSITDARGSSNEMEMAIVGKEDHAGTTGYWMEMSFAEARHGGEMIMKYLVAPKGASINVVRAIMKNSQMGAIEMPEMMLSRINQSMGNLSVDEKGLGKNLGSEVLMTKMGPKKCTHWQKESSYGISDVWVSDDVFPTGMVKSVVKGKNGTTTMELIKQINDAKTKITEEPQKMDLPGGGGMQHPGN